MTVSKRTTEQDKKQRGRPRAFNEKTEQNTIKSLDRALVVLKELAKRQSVTLSEFSKDLGESPATIYRILTTLALHDIVEADEAAQTWHIGPGAFLVGSVFLRRTSLVETSRPILRSLMEQTGETANLGIAKDGNTLFLSQVETHAPIRAFFPPGTLSPLHASGIGKALLAYFDADQLARFARNKMEKFTQYTCADLESLQFDLARTRARGYAFDDQERNMGMRCIAAPIRNAYGEVIAGISVSGPTSRISGDEIDRFSDAVMQAADQISVAMGGAGLTPMSDGSFITL